MNIQYAKSDLLYLRFKLFSTTIVNKKVSEDIGLDIGPDNKIIGIEIPQKINKDEKKNL